MKCAAAQSTPGRRGADLRYNQRDCWPAPAAPAFAELLRFHDFRHDLGTKLLRKTGNLKLVQRPLNHADIKTTTRYAQVLHSEVADAMESIAESRKKSRTKRVAV